jgi:hypothetical protein
MTATGGGTTWAMTTYFNFLSSRRRFENYHRFRERLAVPLVTVELACGNPFQLRPGDADRLLQVQAADMMWQKERLLNLGRRALPEECTRVVWLDCDVVYARLDWPEEVAQLLERHVVAQAYRRCIDLPRDAPIPAPGGEPNVEHEEPSIAFKMAMGTAAPSDFNRSGHRHLVSAGVGIAWAARRDFLDRHGLYDTCIVGGGDRAFTCAIYGRFDDVVQAHSMSDRRAAHYRRWAGPVFEAVRGQVGFVDADVMHLWHGNLENRQVSERHRRLAEFDFDPDHDVAPAPEGVWRWSSSKPAMHAFLRSYFEGRHEDG